MASSARGLGDRPELAQAWRHARGMITLMTTSMRAYKSPTDYHLVGDFLIRHHQAGNRDGNWLQPAWAYMHSHPNLDETALDRIGIWDDAGEVVAVVHYEWRLGEVFFQVHPGYQHLKPEMLAYAERQLQGRSESGERYVWAFVNDFDRELQGHVQRLGYERSPRRDRPLTLFQIPSRFPAIDLPPGFRLKSLADENDLHRMHRVLWRGFNHPGEPPEDGIEGRRKMQSAPTFRHDLNIVVEAPDGQFVAYSGTWFEPTNRIAYVEPVATDPDYRRLGLGTAAVLEGIRRCGAEGATDAYVGSEQPFYLAMGFRPVHTAQCWTKMLDG